MKKTGKYILIALILIVIVLVVGCTMISRKMKANDTPTNTTANVNTADSTPDENNVVNEEVENTMENVVNDVVENTVENTTNTADEQTVSSNKYEVYAEKQFALPAVGEEIATLHVKGYGQIVVKFFPESAPKAVENFITHAKEGYYDGLTFHRVINEFMIQGGDPKGDGTGGETIWGTGIAEEIDAELLPYRGALMMASRGTGTKSIGSQFFIVQANYDAGIRKALNASGWESEILQCYKKYGGYMSLYGSYTLFGQVISGMDVVDKIAAVKTSGDVDKPLTNVVIEKIEVTTYQGQ